jgi:hypothetical protein
MTNATCVIPPHVALTVGPRLLGFLFHWGLYGVLSVQVYLYYLAFPKDPLRNKVWVYLTFFLESVQTIITTYLAFTSFASGYGNYTVFDRGISVSWFSVPLLTGVVASLAQSLYAYRIYVLSQSYTLPAVIMILSAVQLIGSILTAVLEQSVHSFSQILGTKFTAYTTIWGAGSAVCDTVIAVGMVYYLNKRGQGIMKETSFLVRRIMRLVVETGIATATVAIIYVVLVALPNSSYYFTVGNVLAKMYSNSMLVLLNSRMRISFESSNTTKDDFICSDTLNNGQTKISTFNLKNTRDFEVSYSTNTDGVHLPVQDRYRGYAV